MKLVLKCGLTFLNYRRFNLRKTFFQELKRQNMTVPSIEIFFTYHQHRYVYIMSQFRFLSLEERSVALLGHSSECIQQRKPYEQNAKICVSLAMAIVLGTHRPLRGLGALKPSNYTTEIAVARMKRQFSTPCYRLKFQLQFLFCYILFFRNTQRFSFIATF